jgi:hypothetical protein
VISFRARRRQVVRQERRDQIRREIREQIELLERCEAGDPEAIRQAEENGRTLTAAWQEPAEEDYPEPVGYFGARPEPVEPVEPDLPPAWLPQPGESERRFRRRGYADLAERRAVRLLARGYWRIDRPLPGAVREALYAVVLGPRELRRMLAAVWERGGLARRNDARICGPRQQAARWILDLRELPPRAGPGKVARWLEVCLHTGPPAGMQRIASRPEAPLTSP